jgi:EAL domain-containing protein (putative c-di-GMP-specific phosphodiesterase class I)
VICAACAQAQRWNKTSKPFSLPIAINIDISHLQPEFFSVISAALEKYGVAPSSLQFEVSEVAIVDDVARAAAIFRQLRDGGISITIDGFGAGYSSLAALKALPVSAVKIDPCFMQNGDTQYSYLPPLPKFPGDTSIVLALVAMARAFGIRVLVDGVATQEQFEGLKALGCDEYQGAFFSEPLSADDLLQRLQLSPLLSCSA